MSITAAELADSDNANAALQQLSELVMALRFNPEVKQQRAKAIAKMRQMIDVYELSVTGSANPSERQAQEASAETPSPWHGPPGVGFFGREDYPQFEDSIAPAKPQPESQAHLVDTGSGIQEIELTTRIEVRVDYPGGGYWRFYRQ